MFTPATSIGAPAFSDTQDRATVTFEHRSDFPTRPSLIARLRVKWFRRVHGLDVFDAAPGFDVQNRPLETRRAADYERTKPPVNH